MVLVIAFLLLTPAIAHGEDDGAFPPANAWTFRPAVEREVPAFVNNSADLAIAGGPADDWAPMRLGDGWLEQGFNPSRAGWYRAGFELPENYVGNLLAVELHARRRAEAVYINGIPIGARLLREDETDAVSVYLIPPGQTRRPSCTLAIRIDAPGIDEPGIEMVTVRPATLAEYITPQTASTARGEQRPLHRPDGLDFFPRQPSASGDLLINVGSPYYGSAYTAGEAGARMRVFAVNAAPKDDAPISLNVSYTIRNTLTNTEVFSGSFAADVGEAGLQRDVAIYNTAGGAYTIRFVFSSRGVSQTIDIRYAVFPLLKPRAAEAASPFGLIFTEHPRLTRLSGVLWIAQPGMLTSSFVWDTLPPQSPAVVHRQLTEARAAGYRLISPQGRTPHIRSAGILDAANPDDALAKQREAYVRQKAIDGTIVTLHVPDDPNILDMLTTGGESLCDILSLVVDLPAEVRPEEFIAFRSLRLRETLARAGNRPAPAMLLRSAGPVMPSVVVRSYLLALEQGMYNVLWEASAGGARDFVRSDGTPTSLAVAVSVMTDVLGSAVYRGRLILGPTVHGLVFNNGAENVVVVWKTGIAGLVNLPPTQKVMGLMGEMFQMEPSTEYFDMRLSSNPVYLVGVDDAHLQDLIEPAWNPVTEEQIMQRSRDVFAKNPLNALLLVKPKNVQVQHRANEVVLQFENLSQQAFAAEVSLKLPPGWAASPEAVTLEMPAKAGGPIEAAFDVVVPEGETPGTFAAAVNIVAGDASRQENIVFGLTTPVGVFGNIHLDDVHSAAPSLLVPVQNTTDEPVSARVGVAINGWQITPPVKPVRLDPGEERVLRFIAMGELPPVGPLPLTVTVSHHDNTAALRLTADISRQRVHGWSIGKPEVQTVRFDGRRLSYTLTRMSVVSIRIYDAAGKPVRTLDAGWQAAGPHHYLWAPEQEFDAFGNRIRYTAEVRAGFDLNFDREISAPADTTFTPSQVAVGADGALHVLDGARSLRFTRYGRFTGSTIPGLGEDIHSLRPVKGSTYAALKGNSLVLLDAKGRITAATPQQPRPGGDVAAGAFRSPKNLAVSSDGYIYVADTGNHRVQRFTLDLVPADFEDGRGNSLGRISSYGNPIAGTGTGEFTQPNLIATGPAGLLAVADLTGGLQLFDSKGKLLRSGDLPFPDVIALAIDSDGSVFFARSRDNGIYKLRPDLEGLAEFGEDGVLSMPAAIASLAVDRTGRLYVCMHGDSRVVILNSADGSHYDILGDVPSASALFGPSGLDVDEQGNIYVADHVSQQVLRLSPQGQLQWLLPDTNVNLYEPIDLVLHPQGTLYILDRAFTGNRIAAVDLRGRPVYDFEGGSYLLYHDDLARAQKIEVDRSGNIWAGSGTQGTLFNTAGYVIRRNTPPPKVYEREHRTAAGGLQYSPWSEGGLLIHDANARHVAAKGGVGTGRGMFAGGEAGAVRAAAGALGRPDFIYYGDPINRRITVLRVDWATTVHVSN